MFSKMKIINRIRLFLLGGSKSNSYNSVYIVHGKSFLKHTTCLKIIKIHIQYQ